MNHNKSPRILVVTPEVTYLPQGMGNVHSNLCAKAGGLADVSASLISALYDQGGDIHVALPNYRSIFKKQCLPILEKELDIIRKKIPGERIHLAEDRSFFYLNNVYSGYETEDVKISLSFQREVINNIIPRVQPDLIHCNDWMTGLIPSMAKKAGIPCLFTIHNIHTVKNTMEEIEDRGIDAALFWNHLYFDNAPVSYEESRSHNKVDFLLSGVFSAHYVNTVSPTFFREITEGNHHFIEQSLKRELSNKWNAGCAAGILNTPDPTFNPEFDTALFKNYTADNHEKGKKTNKLFLQKKTGLMEDPHAPLFFWPSRLDTIQKGCQLLAEILYNLISTYWEKKLQVIFVADGTYKQIFKDIVSRFNLEKRVAVEGFDENLSRLAYAAADFLFMPSRFEPCGLPQMAGPIYGTLPVAYDTGGIHDTVFDLHMAHNTGNGFLFKHHTPEGLRWATDQAMLFYDQPVKLKNRQIKRIMRESLEKFNHTVTAKQYIQLYEKMLERPFLN